MRAVLLEVPEAMLEERSRLGLDGHDEMWDGVLHMVPPPEGPHQEVGAELFPVFAPLAKRRGLAPRYETGLFRTAQDYRVPDQLYCRPDQLSDRGTEGAELVVEIRSAGDDTYDKIDWYAALGVRELLVVHPADRCVELLRAVHGRLLPVTADAEGAVRSDVLAVRMCTTGKRLRLAWDGGEAEI
ncbi:MAG: Uma2 family endonuclease [Pseudonocardia sp.]